MDDPDDPPRRPTAAELRHHRRTIPRGVPALPDDTPVEPVEPDFEWPAEPDRRDAEVLRRGNRDPEEPVRPAEVSAIVRQLARKMREEFSRLLTDAPRDAIAALDERLDRFERDFEPHRKFGKWVAGVAGAALVAVGFFLYHRGRDEQAVTDKQQHLEERLDRLERRIDSQTGPRP